MRITRNPARLAVQFDDAEATRLRLIELGRFAGLDFPCDALLVSPAAVGSVLGMETVRAAELTQWLRLVEQGYLYELSNAAAKKRGDAQADHDRLPGIDAYLRQHVDRGRRLLDFAKRLLALSDEKRRACVVHVNGAPHDSEIPEFAPRRRGLVRGIGGAMVGEDDCGSHMHACVIQLALKGIGPTATVRPVARFELREQAFRPLWSLATERWIPYLWIGQGDPQKTLTALYVGECVGAVRFEYECWVTKAPAVLVENNPVLCWLSAPSEPNRLAALSFALRHAVERGHDGTPGALATTDSSKSAAPREAEGETRRAWAKRGPKPKTDPKADERIAEAWSSGQHRTFADLEQRLNLPAGTAKRALDRHRKRQ